MEREHDCRIMGLNSWAGAGLEVADKGVGGAPFTALFSTRRQGH